jgi:uncharacterized protein (DUF2225 family)
MELEKKFAKMNIKFDRVAYRAAYDKLYFKKKIVCPVCSCTITKHHLKRHQKTTKCKSSKFNFR